MELENRKYCLIHPNNEGSSCDECDECNMPKTIKDIFIKFYCDMELLPNFTPNKIGEETIKKHTAALLTLISECVGKDDGDFVPDSEERNQLRTEIKSNLERINGI